MFGCENLCTDSGQFRGSPQMENFANRGGSEKDFSRECRCHEEHVASNLLEPQKNEMSLDDRSLQKNLALSEHKYADESINPPCYLPQAGDDVPSPNQEEPMGSVGAWATGKVDWSPLAGLTGIRPIVDHFSITRYSGNEWRQRNKEVLDKAHLSFDREYKNNNACRNITARIYEMVDKTQAETTKRLSQRAQLVNKWKCALERAIKAMTDEITVLEEERVRLKKSMIVLKLPESIVSECLDRRCSRPEPELVRDTTEEELIKELALIAEIKLVMENTLSDIELQQEANKAAKHRLEYDWSDKRETYNIETVNIALKNSSTTILFKPGATRYPAEQSSEEYWEHFTATTLEDCEKCRQKSVTLRSTLDAVVLNAARDLRTQADVVEQALRVRIQCIQELVTRLENELRDCLDKLAATETRIENMKHSIQGLDSAMKVAQTRLDNRSYRPHVENCRDAAQTGLIDEVCAIQQGVTCMLQNYTDAENVKTELMKTRGNLEREIMLKRRTLMLDRERILLLRSRFPSANALSGYVDI